ncbi:MAG TPA: ATP-binding protein [Gaiellaceae bacterium]|nr:ATP-binding protein [Gaiellaceae bacterium]
MSVASQLRLAIGVLILLLAGILAVALYVPWQLQQSATERYVDDVIPLRGHVHRLRESLLEQEAAFQAFLLTRDTTRQAQYSEAQAVMLTELAQIKRFDARHPELVPLEKRMTSQLADLTGRFEQQLVEQNPAVRAQLAQQLEQSLGDLQRTSQQMLTATDRTVADAKHDQRDRFRQLFIILALLGTLALAIGIALFLLTPRRLGDLYEAELSSRQEAESRAEAARALEHVSDGVILTDDSGRVRFWNPAAAKLTGIDEYGAIGRELGLLLPGWERLAQQPDAHPGLGGAAVVPLELGHERWLSITSVDFGEGVVYAVRDVTEERALETMRSDFVTTASHELRTPMTSISGAARTLLRHGEELPDGRQNDFLKMIVSESDRLSRIVDQILLASRIEAGRIEVLHERCDAAAIASSVVESVKHRAPHDVDVVLDVNGRLPHVDCDPDRLRQVLGNLIDNAVKYSPDGGEVRIELDPNGEMMRFSVRDQGLGFDQAAAERIFERFYRVDPEQTRGIGGTGLGLYISRELVNRMGGRIWAESEPGQGASLFFELPLARDAARL